MNDIKKELLVIEGLVENRKIKSAQDKLKRIYKKYKLTRSESLLLATLFRKVFMPEMAIKILHKYVYPNIKSSLIATDKEIAQYAQSLNQINVLIEASVLFEKVNPDLCPDVYIFLAHNNILRTKYKEAEKYIVKYIQHPKATKEGKLIAESFYPKIMIFYKNDYKGAEDYLERYIKKIKKQNKTITKIGVVDPKYIYILNAYVFAMINQYYLNNCTKALDYLSLLYKEFPEIKEINSSFGLRINAWNLLVNLKQLSKANSDSLFVLKKIKLIKNKLAKSKDPISLVMIRLIDFETAKILNENKKLIELYFSARDNDILLQIHKEIITRKLELPDEYIIKIGEDISPNVEVNVQNGKNNLTKFTLKEKQVPQRLFEILAADINVPLRIAELNDLLFDGEHYNPYTSPDRVHKAIKRLRHWFGKTKVPLDILSTNGMYKLVSKSGCSIIVTRVNRPGFSGSNTISISDINSLKLLYNKISFRDFSSIVFAKELNVSKKTASRILNRAIKHKMVIKKGNGPSVKYSFADAFIKQIEVTSEKAA